MSEILEANSLDQLPKETLVQTLLDKLKEQKQMQKKLDKLQEKYVATFKEHKLITKDRDIFMQILSQIFNEEPYKLDTRAMGQYELNNLIDLLSKREDEKSKILTQLIRETNQEKCIMDDKYKQMIEKSSQSSDQKSQQLIKQLKNQINDLEHNNTRLAKEIIELNDIIQLKNQHIQHMSKLEEEYTNLKTSQIVNELQNAQQDRQYKIQSSDTLNDQIKVKQQIDKLLDEIYRLKQQVKHYEQQHNAIEIKKQNSTPSQIIDYEINPFGEEETQLTKQQSQQQQQQQQIKNLKDISVQTDMPQQQQSTENNLEYLKEETRNYKEAQILMNAILNILKISKDERTRLQQAKERGFFKNVQDNLFCMKPTQLNDISLMKSAPPSKLAQMNMHMN